MINNGGGKDSMGETIQEFLIQVADTTFLGFKYNFLKIRRLNLEKIIIQKTVLFTTVLELSF